MSACCNQQKPVKEPEGSCPWPWVCSLESGAHGTIVHSFIYISQNRYLVSAQQVPSKEGNTESWTKLPSWSLCSNRENGLRTMPGCFYWLFLSSLKSVCKHLEGREQFLKKNFFFKLKYSWFTGFSGGSEGKESACRAGDAGSIPGSEDPLEKVVATHPSILAWRISWTE